MQSYSRLIKEYEPLLMLIYLGLTGSFCTTASMKYMHQSFNILPPLFFFGLFSIIYFLNRLTDIREDFANKPERFSFLTRHRHLYYTGIGSGIISVAIIIITMQFKLYHMLLISIGILYSIRILPWHTRKNGLIFLRIKELPLIKNIVVSVLWGSAVFIIPMLFTENRIGNSDIIYILMISLGISTFNNTLFCDIRDYTGDKATDTKTLPVLLGRNKSLLIIGIVDIIWLTAIVFFYISNVFFLSHLVFLLALVLYPVFYIIPSLLCKIPDKAINILCESDLIFFSAGLLILSYF